MVASRWLTKRPERYSDQLSIDWLATPPGRVLIPNTLLKALNMNWGSLKGGVHLSSDLSSLISVAKKTEVESLLSQFIQSVKGWEVQSAKVIHYERTNLQISISGSSHEEALTHLRNQLQKALGTNLSELFTDKIIFAINREYPVIEGQGKSIQVTSGPAGLILRVNVGKKNRLNRQGGRISEGYEHLFTVSPEGDIICKLTSEDDKKY